MFDIAVQMYEYTFQSFSNNYYGYNISMGSMNIVWLINTVKIAHIYRCAKYSTCGRLTLKMC